MSVFMTCWYLWGFSLSLKTIHSIASSIQYIQNRIISPTAEQGPCLASTKNSLPTDMPGQWVKRRAGHLKQQGLYKCDLIASTGNRSDLNQENQGPSWPQWNQTITLLSMSSENIALWWNDEDPFQFAVFPTPFLPPRGWFTFIFFFLVKLNRICHLTGINLLLGMKKQYRIKKQAFFASHSCDSVVTQKEVCHLLNHRNHFL